MKAPFAWDTYSDQPLQLKDRSYKKMMRRRERRSLLQTVLTSLLVTPVALLSLPFLSRKPIDTQTLVGLVVDPQRAPDATIDALRELKVRELVLRIPLWDPALLQDVVTFVQRLPECRFLFVLMQDREHVEDAALRRAAFERIFTALLPYSARFQIGSTFNRAKWGCFSPREYLHFFKTAQELKHTRFPELILIGPGVIDFEYHMSIGALFNASGVRFDAASALLYVDRRGAPENTQMGCDLPCKINLMAALVRLSPFARFPLYITETNWPLQGTAPYAPTSEKECVSEEAYASFMVRYFLLALATQQVRTIYWHQLIAPGYGLMDSREAFRARPAFAAFKTLQAMLDGATYRSLHVQACLHEMVLQKQDTLLRIFWCPDATHPLSFAAPRTVILRDGETIETDRLDVNDAPVYLPEPL